MPRNIANPNRTSVSPRPPAEMSASPSAHPVDTRPHDAAPLQPGEIARAADGLATDDDLRHRPPTGPLGKQAAKVRDAVDRRSSNARSSCFRSPRAVAQ